MANIAISEIQTVADTLENEDLILVSKKKTDGSFQSARMTSEKLKSSIKSSIPTATTSTNGFMSSSDKLKLDGMTSLTNEEVIQDCGAALTNYTAAKTGDITSLSNKIDGLNNISTNQVTTSCETAITNKGVSTLTAEQIQTMLNNMTAKPVFYDTDNAVVTKPTSTQSSTDVQYTATSDGCAFCSWEATAIASNAQYSYYTVTLNEQRVGIIGYNGLKSVSGEGTRGISDSFRINMKSGQTIKLTCNSGSTGLDVQITFLPFL